MEHDRIDPQIYDLYDEYCHGAMERREFLSRAAALTVVGGGSGFAMARSMLPDYARAETVSAGDPRIKTGYVDYDSPGGTSGRMRGYLARPARAGKFAAIVVIHENRGLNPYIEDVARRLAVEGFLALAPDGLAPIGGYPGNDDEGKRMQRSLDRSKLRTDLLNSARYLKAHLLSNGKLGATGFCYGGGVVNFLAVRLGADLNAAVPFYGAAPRSADVARIKAPLLLHFAENDDWVNKKRPGYEAALKAAGVTFEMHEYPGTRHGFHNDTTPRYNEAAAKLAWQRTVAFFKAHLS